MAMPVMQIGVMRMGVAKRRVAVPMRMRFADRPVMRVPVVRVVSMVVLVFERLVRMLVNVAFARCIHSPNPIKRPASTRFAVTPSCRRPIANTAPMNGASEK